MAQRAGVGRYTRSLVQYLPVAAQPEDELVVFYFDFLRRALPLDAPNLVSRVCRWFPGRIVQAAWKHFGCPRYEFFAGTADVYHFPNFVLPPLGRGKTAAVTIHDISFLRLPEFAEEKNRKYLAARIPDTARRAGAILTASHFCAEEIATELRVPQDRIFVVYNGIGEEFRPAEAGAVESFRKRARLDRPYLLTVGTIEPRKNLPFLVEVFEHLQWFDGYLVLAGMRGWKYEPILQRLRSSPRASRIRWLEYVDDADLPVLYSGAELFVCASVYEGFGFPPLEAMSCGIPVVASRGGALPEILGEAALMPQAFDTGLWVTTIERVLGSEDERNRLSAAGRKHAAKYTWMATARRTWEVYRRLYG
ncbi:MAG: glycosyltransferase family 4 protein [Kiritimatiellae bacterium]|nr:glycosyltransferase family 4 protein [Kiritimatiellia bacterium]